jgi:transcriptional regulator with XRE-family HTH domain
LNKFCDNLVNGSGAGHDQRVAGSYLQVKIMAKPKKGRSTAAIDDHVGARIRERRIMLGLTQQQLAEMIGVTYQQAHKYERGINRVSAGRLFEIARTLSAPISYFYEGVGEEGPRQITPHQRMLLEIARNFAEIRNEKHQEAVSQLARALAS